MQQKDQQLPTYPALAKCVIIDARFKSRKKVAKDVAATELFESIVEACCVADGKEIALSSPADIIVIGPSVSEDKAFDFINFVKGNMHSPDCAILAISHAQTTKPDVFIAHGAQEAIDSDSSLRQLFDAIIRAVIRMNENNPWGSILLEQLGDETIYLQQVFPERSGTISVVGGELDEKEETVVVAGDGDLFDSMFDDETGALSQILKDVNEGTFGLLDDGTLTQEARARVLAMVDGILAGFPDSPQTQALRNFLERAITDWVIDVTISGEKVARREFRKKIDRFRTSRAGV